MLVINILASFMFGGFVVALISFIAERMPPKISGLLIAMPSTVVVSLLFIALTLSNEAVEILFPTIPVSLGASLIQVLIYILVGRYLHKKGRNKTCQILFSTMISLAVWFTLSVPIALLKFSNSLLSILIYLLLVIITQAAFIKQFKSSRQIAARNYSLYQKLGRAVFSGAIIAVTVLVAKLLGPFWGGIMSMFPAAFLSALVILNYYYDPDKLFGFFATTPFGTSSLIIYAWVAALTFPPLGPWIGTLISFIVSASFTLLLMGLFKRIQNLKRSNA